MNWRVVSREVAWAAGMAISGVERKPGRTPGDGESRQIWLYFGGGPGRTC